MSKGTEAFPDLGEHCEQDGCNQLDFLPFTCAGCEKVFCLEHRTYKAHSCPRSNHNSRTVAVCTICSLSIDKMTDEKEDDVLERHARSGVCDPAKKQKPKCPVKRCKELLTFSNTTTCKTCDTKVCLKHRFPTDHNCRHATATVRSSKEYPFLLAARKGSNCRDLKEKKHASPSITVS
ncbi:zinc finger AN1 and C2H2 domain-containing stress-associated protein 11 [Iris pallida]|uniref:Zinc finger AN1 and C2H2 domain-containing stress-associated protein 11 n=1 Tax=Iris pallida TaxID=29817 RepID=A0AAX6GRI0_IRIPA|nr:zinc finger AN1 and C2H2 domain-containing stress-associated protein 11 [Iris pallida]